MEGTKALIKKKDHEEITILEKETEIVSTVVNLVILQEIAENQEEMEEMQEIDEVVIEEEDAASDLIHAHTVEEEKILGVEVIVGDEGQGQIVETAIKREEVGEVIAEEEDHTLEKEVEEAVEVGSAILRRCAADDQNHSAQRQLWEP